MRFHVIETFLILSITNLSLFVLSCEPPCKNCLPNSQILCLDCLQGFYHEANDCLMCPQSCRSCLSNTKCTMCSQLHYLQNEENIWKCSQCPNMCSICKIEKNCLRCDQRIICDKACITYFLTNKDCKHKEENNQALIVGFTIGFSLFVCAGTFIFLKARRKNRLGDSSLNNQSAASGETSLRQFSEVLNLTWSKHGGEELDFTVECSICLDKGVNTCTPCRHMFHISCLAQWIHKNQICPNCRSWNIHSIKIYCKVCHRNFVEKELRHCKMLRFTSSIDLCDFCRSI